MPPYLESALHYLKTNWVLIPFALLTLWLLLRLLKLLIWKLFSFDSKLARILEQKKSSEVRLGKISETLAPLLASFPVDIRKPGTSTVYLGQPVDFVHFDPDTGITFIEVKSGDSKLNVTQRKIRELVSSGRIEWKECKVK
ncbi:MAG: hypothetical protein J5J00_07590 [Deltaproteobacteria bacterium]|nr:hypothetical protein [Deltaproteobacteria bacterium]